VAAVLGLLIAGSLAALLALAGRLETAPWPLGVPLALWILFGGLWLVPLALTGLGYALSFEAPRSSGDPPSFAPPPLADAPREGAAPGEPPAAPPPVAPPPAAPPPVAPPPATAPPAIPGERP
jgi:hypothetical protein